MNRKLGAVAIAAFGIIFLIACMVLARQFRQPVQTYGFVGQQGPRDKGETNFGVGTTPMR